MAKMSKLFMISIFFPLYFIGLAATSKNPIDLLFLFYDKYENNIAQQTPLPKTSLQIEMEPRPPTNLLTSNGNNNNNNNNLDIQTSNRIPQSFTILMNFQHDGTTSLQILHNSMFWSDSVLCQHGQIYDPLIMNCREIFCMQGYILSPQGCIEDANSNSSIREPVRKPPAEMKLELVLKHTLCTFKHNDTTSDGQKCDQESKVIEPNEDLLDALKSYIVRTLNVNKARSKLQSGELHDLQ